MNVFLLHETEKYGEGYQLLGVYATEDGARTAALNHMADVRNEDANARAYYKKQGEDYWLDLYPEDQDWVDEHITGYVARWEYRSPSKHTRRSDFRLALYIEVHEVR